MRRALNVKRALRAVLRKLFRVSAVNQRENKHDKISEQKHLNKGRCELTGISNGGGVQQIHARAGQR